MLMLLKISSHKADMSMMTGGRLGMKVKADKQQEARHLQLLIHFSPVKQDILHEHVIYEIWLP